MTKKEQKAAEVAANKFAAFNKKLTALTGHLYVSSEARKAAFEANKSADEYAAELAALEPVGLALHPMKVEAVNAATKWANEKVERIKADLAAHDWDINKTAPYPKSGETRLNYMMGLLKYQTYSKVTKTDDTRTKPYRGFNEPHFVNMSDSGIARFVNEAETEAAFQYDMFIVKMVAKVGKCDNATIKGDHIWSYSILTVTKGDKIENWKTQQITNVSKLGKYFPQWPSRLMK